MPGIVPGSVEIERPVNEATIDVSAYQRGGVVFRKPLHLIVKSLDQVERRARLIESKQRGRIGRIEAREIATGLWARLSLPHDGVIDRSSCRIGEFREPRGLVDLGDGKFLISDVDRVMRVDADARVLREYSHPFFSFLHSISFDRIAGRFLVVSSGYDCLIEMDLDGKVCWEWYAWEHGFNPTLDGIYLCRTKQHLADLQAYGKTAVLVEPSKLGAYGLMTSQRSNHPNSACYHSSDRNRVLVTLGHSGEVIEIQRDTGAWRSVVSGLRSMPHGIQPYSDGWMVTNTLLGEFWLLDRDFKVQTKVITRNLSGKPEEMAEHEWLQAAYPVHEGYFIAADANRGLITIDINLKQYRIMPVDESWCVHHLMLSS